MRVIVSMPMNQKGTGLVHKVTEFTFSLWCNVQEKLLNIQANIILLVPIQEALFTITAITWDITQSLEINITQ